MADKVITPKFLTVDIAKIAIEAVLSAVLLPSPIGGLMTRQGCHIIILVPAMKDDREADYPDWPNYPISPHVLYEHSVEKEEWPAACDNIARCKALQLWHERNDDRTDCTPHLLFPGDTPYWGGVRRHGIVVACSGVQAHFDKMISGMVADMVVGLAYNAWMISDDKKNSADWLT
jgi:hypothetical protein